AIDVYVLCLTKFASGHGDVMGGAVIVRAELIDAMRTDFIMVGATLDPHAAFLIQRGMKTYVLRYERQCANALSIARFLEMRPEVARVHYPGLASNTGHALARQQMHDAGAIVTIDLQPGMNTTRVAEAPQL